MKSSMLYFLNLFSDAQGSRLPIVAIQYLKVIHNNEFTDSKVEYVVLSQSSFRRPRQSASYRLVEYCYNHRLCFSRKSLF